MAWASCGRKKLALLQLPVLVKYRIALVGVPVASDLRILSFTSQDGALRLVCMYELLERMQKYYHVHHPFLSHMLVCILT
jgi:hypothetical protein